MKKTPRLSRCLSADAFRVGFRIRAQPQCARLCLRSADQRFRVTLRLHLTPAPNKWSTAAIEGAECT